MRRFVTLCVGALFVAPFALHSSAPPAHATRAPSAPAVAVDPGPPPDPAWAEAEAWRRIAAWVEGIEAENRRQWIAGVEASAAAPQRDVPRGTSTIGGSCAAMAPPGFPASIIQRESGGNPNAVNASSGALGCAQILPSWFSGACSGLSYSACWALLWNGGAGAGNWSTG